MRGRAISTVFFAVLTTTASIAAADALAEALFRDAKQLLAAGKVREACAKLAESQRIEPKIGTLANLAVCHEQEGKLASAWAEFNQVADQALQLKQPDREKFARDHAAQLEPRVPRIALQIATAVPQMEIAIGDRSVSLAAAATPIPMDAGTYTLKVTAPGYKTFTREITLGTSAGLTNVEIPKLEQADAATSSSKPEEAAKPSPNNNTDRAEAPAPSTDSGSTRRTVGFILGGVGLVGVGVGSYLGLRSFSSEADADALCQGKVCTQKGLDLHEDAKAAATLSTFAFAIGLAGIAAGAYFLLTSPSPAKRATLVVGPTMSGGLRF